MNGINRRTPRSADWYRSQTLRQTAAVLGFSFWLIVNPQLLADQIAMQNGDTYVGDVLSLDAHILVLQSELLGTVKLPRNKVATIRFGSVLVGNGAPTKPATNTTPRALVLAGTNVIAAPPVALPKLPPAASTLREVQEQYLAGASPEATQKFTELAGGLLTGRLSIEDIRVQAKSAAEQLRGLKAELGEGAGDTVDSYLSILDKFLSNSTAASAQTTNAPVKSVQKESRPH